MGSATTRLINEGKKGIKEVKATAEELRLEILKKEKSMLISKGKVGINLIRTGSGEMDPSRMLYQALKTAFPYE